METNYKPCPCPDIQAKIDKLKWAQTALKETPNLPNGMLKESIQADLSRILGDRASLRSSAKNLITSLRSVGSSFNSLDTFVSRLPERSTKALDPYHTVQSADEVSDVISEVVSLLESIS